MDVLIGQKKGDLQVGHAAKSRLTSPHLASPLLTSPHLASPRLTSPHLASPRLTAPHRTPSHLASPPDDVAGGQGGGSQGGRGHPSADEDRVRQATRQGPQRAAVRERVPPAAPASRRRPRRCAFAAQVEEKALVEILSSEAKLKAAQNNAQSLIAEAEGENNSTAGLEVKRK
jgi:hypothetical protein